MPIYRQKRSPFWWYTVTIDGKRVRKSTGIRNAKFNRPAAQQVEADALSKVRSNGLEAITQKPPVLRDFADSFFLTWVKDSNSIKPKTKTYYQTGWGYLKNTPLADMRMDRVTNIDVQMTTFPGANYAANCAICTLSRMFGLAKEMKRIAFDLPTFKKREVVGRSIGMSNGDAQKIADVMGEGDPRDALLILRATGMRPGECYAMRWEFVNWDANCYRNPNGKTKTAQRWIPLLPDALNVLLRRRLVQGTPAEGWVFPSDSKSGHIVAITKAFNIARRKAGLPSKLCLYTARHGAATDFAQVSTLKELMTTLGHADSRTCMRYQHPDVATLQAKLVEAKTSGRIM